MTLISDRERADSDELNRVLLTIAYPAFRFTILAAGAHRSTWLAVRRRRADRGVHTVITGDLDEMQEVLGQDQPPPGQRN